MRRNHRWAGDVHQQPLDFLNWPVLGVSFLSWPWLGHFWDRMPTATALYMTISAGFMLFQMADKLGLLNRFKRREPSEKK